MWFWIVIRELCFFFTEYDDIFMSAFHVFYIYLGSDVGFSVSKKTSFPMNENFTVLRNEHAEYKRSETNK